MTKDTDRISHAERELLRRLLVPSDIVRDLGDGWSDYEVAGLEFLVEPSDPLKGLIASTKSMLQPGWRPVALLKSVHLDSIPKDSTFDGDGSSQTDSSLQLVFTNPSRYVSTNLPPAENFFPS